ncbi:hypothetical protein [Flavisolibacter tropicus]|uniref:Tetratricopeptide repeat protein n=1 Tax=Flavisolibacter tropicus TaxID=1492898 RepID=A0A172TUK5_9BACT|nr:hypothetical protein [Flavisolibacter tropicus]ANE50769.1 hypothetical protein SY85_09915 [Flavisolibacter tropicus]
MHFYDLLTNLYESFSPEKAEEAVAFIRQELSFEVLYEQYDGQTLRTLINDHHEAFYECLARELVEDLDKEPMVYFRDWQPLLAFLDRRSTQLLYYYAEQQAFATDVQELIKGLRQLDCGQYQVAMHCFHQCPHYIRHYFIGRCYIAMGAYENAIHQHDWFLNTLIDFWPLPEDETDESEELHYFLMAQWHIYKDFAHCHTQLGNYEDAQMNYELAFNYFTHGNVYVLSQGRFGQEAQLFHTMTSQYLLALEKTERYDVALEYATFALKHFPYDAYYSSVQQRCEAALGQQDFADQLLTQVFQSSTSSNLLTPPSPLVTALRQWALEQLAKDEMIFDKNVRVYNDELGYGEHLYIPGANGFVDLLLEDVDTGILYAVSFSTPDNGNTTADQLERCRIALTEAVDKEVKGILCLYGSEVEGCDVVNSNEYLEVYAMPISLGRLG